MTKPKVGGTNHRWLVEDTQSLLIELAGHHKAVIENLRREHLSNAALELAQAGQTLVALQRMLGQMQLLIASGEATSTGKEQST
jgi:hypothetical protein